MAELFLASLALMLWLVIEPGGVRAILFNVMAIAGISTVIFNGNPLLRFDGYYILGDLIESPNLGVRANRYWGYLVEKYLFAIPNLAPYEIAAGERKWLLWYAPLAFAYRLVVACAIALYLASEFFVLGVLLGLASLFGMLVKPLLKGLAYVLIGPRAASKRPRVISVTCVAVAIAAILVGATPAPLRTQSEGVIWLPIQAEVRAGTAGFIEELLLDPGKTVAVGQPIARCSDPLLEVQIKVAKARVIELERQRAAELVSDRVQAAVTAESLRRERARLQRAEQRAEELLIRSPVTGRLMLAANPQDLPGRYLRHGELLAYVVDGSTTQARVIVDQNDVDLVRRTVQAVEVRFADRPEDIYPTRIVREVPQAEAELPSAALGTAGGGRRLLDPEDPEGRRALGSVFQFDVALPPRYTESTFTPYGARVHVRFSHDWEPLGTQWARRLRQLFLSRLNV